MSPSSGRSAGRSAPGETTTRAGGAGARWLAALAALAGLALAGALGGWLWFRAQLDAVIPAPSASGAGGEYLRVPRGAGFAAVAAELRRLGWIETTWPVRLEARRRGWDRRVIPGWYRWRREERVRELLSRLARGEIEEARLTIPEGWRMERILGAIADSAWVARDSLLALARDPGWLARHGLAEAGLEGFLFPETYRIPRGGGPADLLAQVLRPGEVYWSDSLAAEASRQGLSRREVWTLASIIEAEAGVAHERPLISAVFRNRLRRGMRLESDPTVLYAHGRPPGRVLYADLEIDSPYNTYRRAGLPPGPICSPGRASLRAALHPAERTDLLFFVARGDGSHVFSRTLAEHNHARRVLSRRRP